MTTRETYNAAIDAALAPLNLSGSAAADWKLLRDITVTTAMSTEFVCETLKADIDNALATKQYGSLAWYAAISRQFQNGDSLTVIDGVVGYATDSPNARIITKAAVRELDEELIAVKVAKSVNGAPTALSGAELANFRNYLLARRAPGVKLTIVSAPPDGLRYTLQVLFDPRYDQTQLHAAITAALARFRDDFPFDAMLYRAQLMEAVMGVQGVVNVTGAIALTFTGGAILDLADGAELPAGYFDYHPLSLITLAPAP